MFRSKGNNPEKALPSSISSIPSVSKLNDQPLHVPPPRKSGFLNAWDEFAVRHPFLSKPLAPIKHKIDERQVMGRNSL